MTSSLTAFKIERSRTTGILNTILRWKQVHKTTGSSLFCDTQSIMLFAELDLQKAKTFVAGDILPQCEICSINVRVVVSFAAMISGCLTYRKIFREIFNWFLEGTLIVECPFWDFYSHSELLLYTDRGCCRFCQRPSSTDICLAGLPWLFW